MKNSFMIIWKTKVKNLGRLFKFLRKVCFGLGSNYILSFFMSAFEYSMFLRKREMLVMSISFLFWKMVLYTAATVRAERVRAHMGAGQGCCR